MRSSVWGLLLSCGPSFEVLHEGDLRFAHCDRLDLDPAITSSHRLHCWREWRRVYSFGQTRDRVEYAQGRIARLVSGDTQAPFRLPTQSLAPDERPMSRSLQAEPRAGSAPPSCQRRCVAQRASCLKGCETKPTGCEPCLAAHRQCSAGCG